MDPFRQREPQPQGVLKASDGVSAGRVNLPTSCRRLGLVRFPLSRSQHGHVTVTKTRPFADPSFLREAYADVNSRHFGLNPMDLKGKP